MLRLLFVLLAALGTTTRASGEDYRLLQIDGRPVKWGAPAYGAGAVVTYAYVSEAMRFDDARNCRSMQPIDPVVDAASVDRATVEDEAAQAFALWERAADIRFELVGDPAAADILIGTDGDAPRSARADVLARSDEGPVGVIRRGLICLSAQQAWKVGHGGDPDAQDLRRTLAHEIGHALGLDHPGPRGAMMAFTYDEEIAALQAGDIAGAAALYGPARSADGDAVAALGGSSSGAASPGFH